MKQPASASDTIHLREIYRRLAELNAAQITELSRTTGIGRSTLYQYKRSPEELKRARGSTLLALQRALEIEGGEHAS